MHFFVSVGPICRLLQKLPDDISSSLNNMASSLGGGGGGGCVEGQKSQFQDQI